MTKPDDIPQDVWNAALKCGETALRNMPDDYGDLSIEIEAIARAIMAERERCADQAAEAVDLPPGTYGLASIESFWRGVRAGAQALRAAIRKGPDNET